MSSKELEFLHEVLPRCVWDKSYASDDVHITLTFAQSLDGKIAGVGGKQLILSGKESMIMTHW
jgi:2,5-diamino-6-(ribosylamino)-4(3H)-pyrimidinone 5'-phosphate reductase